MRSPFSNFTVDAFFETEMNTKHADNNENANDSRKCPNIGHIVSGTVLG